MCFYEALLQHLRTLFISYCHPNNKEFIVLYLNLEQLKEKQ